MTEVTRDAASLASPVSVLTAPSDRNTMTEATMDMIHALNERVSLIEQRLLGGTESFAEHRKEIRDLRKQVSDLRDIIVELAGRDGQGGTIAALSEMATTLKDAVERLDVNFAAIGPDVKRLAGIGDRVETLTRIYWKLGVLATLGGTLAGSVVGIVLHFLGK